MANGIIQQLIITIMKLELPLGMDPVFMEKKQPMVKFLTKIKLLQLIKLFRFPQLLKLQTLKMVKY